MGSLRVIQFKRSYNSDYDDILNDFYIPALQASDYYFRMAGFFSSTSLAVAAKGLQGLIANSGKMKLLCSAKLSKGDIEVIEKGERRDIDVLDEKFGKDIESISNEFVLDHLKALAWMLANKYLEIKIMIVTDESGKPIANESVSQAIFHPKVGILRDAHNDKISFSGSDNETAMGWTAHIEQFKVFNSWEPALELYFKPDCDDFRTFWTKGVGKRCRTVEPGEAIRQKLVSLAPDNSEKLALEKWRKRYKRNGGTISKRIELSPVQKEARDNWRNRGKRGVFEMATGTGKTFAAISCIELEFLVDDPILVVIAAPFDHLLKQWKKEIARYGLEAELVIADSSNTKWKDEVADKMTEVNLKRVKRLIVLTTHRSLSSDTMVSRVRNLRARRLLIVDEVHGIGAPELRKGLLEDYEMRIGLSATPRRWMDEEGSGIIQSYFGEISIVFGLKEAIETINPLTGKPYLVPYDYYPLFSKLTDEEVEQYGILTKRIARRMAKLDRDNEIDETIRDLLIKRQKILTDSEDKYDRLRELLIKEDLSNCLIYCSETQMRRILEMVSRRGLVAGKFTMNEDVTPRDEFGGLSEREMILTNFEKGIYDVLVAIRCLDEGVDIRPARIGIIMCSSGNELQFVQRRGRLLRPSEGKEYAVIYDIIPYFQQQVYASDGTMKMVGSLTQHEMRRFREFAGVARNHHECLKRLVNLELGSI